MNELSELEQVTTNWIPFRGKNPLLRKNGTRVTLVKDRDLYLSERALKALGDPLAVSLFFDVTLSRIGMKKDAIDAPHAYPVNRNRKKGAMVSARAFCRQFNIQIEASIEFNDVSVDKNGMMILDLGKVTRVR